MAKVFLWLASVFQFHAHPAQVGTDVLSIIERSANTSFGLPFVHIQGSSHKSVDIASTRPAVGTKLGKVMGISNGSVNVFRGLPFAEAPIGALRWRPPQPAKPWSGTLDAGAFQNRCVDSFGRGDEDCLYLNVFAPATSKDGGLPCLLWVHGGGYEGGSSNDYDATDLVKFYVESGQSALVITINYRLNIFGFLGSVALRGRDEVDGSTGNYGIQDQRAAFQWVQDNIEAFGGDPQRVMIYGESAGAGSMSNHLSMPRSAGLFSSVAIESGSFSSWVAQPLSYSEEVYQQVLSFTGCKEVLCLETLAVTNLTAAVLGIPVGHCCGGLAGKPWIPWAPTVDGVELVAHPWELAKQGKLNKVPVLHGTNTDEGSMFEQLSCNTTSEHFVKTFKSWYGPAMGDSRAADVAVDVYLKGESHPHVPSLSNAWWGAERSMGDQAFACPAQFASAQLAAHGLNVFQYLFTHGSLVYHGAEIPYVFMNINQFKSLEEKVLSEQVASYWYRQAAFGNPNGQHASATSWPRFETGAERYLQVDVASAGGLRVVEGPLRSKSCFFMREWLEGQVGSPSAGSMAAFVV